MEINTLPEVISKDSFLTLLDKVIKNEENLTPEMIIQYLDILGEKFEKFYDIHVIGSNERNSLFEILKKNTKFNQLNIIEDLISIMFQYRIDKYADYLKSQLGIIESKEIFNEVKDAIEEYERIK